METRTITYETAQSESGQASGSNYTKTEETEQRANPHGGKLDSQHPGCERPHKTNKLVSLTNKLQREQRETGRETYRLKATLLTSDATVT